jgi:hypothetical protein
MSQQRISRWISILSCIGALAFVGAASAANPAGLYYQDHADAPYTNIASFYAPTALLVTGRCNRTNPHFAQARAAGAEVLAYIDPVDILTTPARCAAEFFIGAQLWPHKDAQGNDRVNWKKSKLGDLRVGSSWANAVVAYVERLMREGNVDGVMLDVVGAKLWAADWKHWPESEQNEWTAGNVDLVRRLDESRKRIDPSFIIINNNFWNPKRTAPDPNVVYPGEQYVDGIVIENHAATEMNSRAIAGRRYGSPGDGVEHRRVLVITRSPSDAVAWTDVAGVTHVALQGSSYRYAEPPVVSPTPLTDRRTGSDASTGARADRGPGP